MMLCATCGAMNQDTAPRCGNCGAPLESKLGSRAASDASPWFAPIAHSPFSNEPLPQPSDPLPRLQPVGEIQTFTPMTPPEQSAYSAPATPAAFADLELADYPTRVNVPVPNKQRMQTPAPISTQQGTPPSASPGGQPQANRSAPPSSWPGNSNYPSQQMEESYAAMYQAPPSLGNVYPGPGHNPPSLGNVYPGPEFTSGALSATEIHPFVHPLPLWMFLLSSIVGAGLLTALVFLNPDWATGALIAGTIALFAGLLLLIAAGVRVALGLLDETNPRRRSQVISTVLLVLMLFLTSGVGMTQQNSLHAAQARYLEDHQNWQLAIDEYKASGETAPASVHLARIYNEWGEDLSRQQHYAEAVARFSTVLQSYSQVTDQLDRAKTDVVAAYLAWGDAAIQQQDYAGASLHYDAVLVLSYCNTGCQSQAGSKDAGAYAHLAEQQLSAQQFAPAVNTFTSLTTRFASSPEAKQAHADYAKALWGLGQQQLNTTCSDAVKTYQQLAQQFADTGQGNQAATALKQPVTVKGRFTTPLPGAPYSPTVALVHGLVVGIQQYQFPPLLHNAPMVQIQSDGTFTFTSVPQGDYELVWSNDGTLHFYYANNGSQVLYTAHLGPLCTYNYGDINETISTKTK